MKECRVCKTMCPDELLYCRVCGTKFPEQPYNQKEDDDGDQTRVECGQKTQPQVIIPMFDEKASATETVSSSKEDESKAEQQSVTLSYLNQSDGLVIEENQEGIKSETEYTNVDESNSPYEVEEIFDQNNPDDLKPQHEELNHSHYQSNSVVNNKKLNPTSSKSKALPVFVIAIICVITFIVLELTDTTFFIPSWHTYSQNDNQDNYENNYDSRHGIVELDKVDGLRIIESSNYIMGALEGQIYDARYIPENMGQLTYFPSGLLELWNSTDNLYFSKMYEGRIVTVQTNVGDLLSGEGWLSCLCNTNGQDQQIDAIAIDSTTFQYEIPENASELLNWWICNTYGGIDEKTGNEVTGMIYFNIIDGMITEATIAFSNQETSIFFKSVKGQYNEVNYARSGVELNLKYDFYNNELISSYGF